MGNTIKPFLLKRMCRICSFDKAPNDSELVKHIESEHPKSEFWVDDSEEEELEVEDKEKVEVAPEVKEVKPAVKEEDNLSELETRFLNSRAESEDGLDFEPNEDYRSPSPAKI